MANLKPIGEAQWLVTVEGIDGLWNKLSAPKEEVEKIKYVDPQKMVVRTHPGAITRADITIGKHFDVETDKAIVTWLQDRRKGKNVLTPFTVTMSAVYPDSDGTPYEGAPKFSFTNCILLDATYPGADKDSKNLTSIEMTFNYDEIKLG